MCMTDYIKERTQNMERDAADKIALLTDVVKTLIEYEQRARQLPRSAGIVAMLLHARAAFVAEQAAAFRVIEECNAIQREMKEVEPK